MYPTHAVILQHKNCTNALKLLILKNDVTYTKPVSFHYNNSSTARVIEHYAVGAEATIAPYFIDWLLRF